MTLDLPAAMTGTEAVNSPVAQALLYSLLGILVYVLGFVIIDKLTPGNLWKEIFEGKNTALAILVGCLAIGLSIIIAAAVHG